MRRKTNQLHQTIQNLTGEVKFREKLAYQHTSGEILLPDYYSKEQHDQILLKRMQDTQQRMEQLVRRGVVLTPFLELGAERGQRSLVLANDIQAQGIAIDISYHQLKTMEHFSHLFNREVLPLRVCCDANHLPFRSNSFPFIFCYQFLHHFPALQPVLQEVFRVLSGGYFFFDEEPFKRWLKFELYKQRNKIYSEEMRGKNKYLTLLESFISEEQCDETEFGILENNNITLAEWLTALSLFDERELDLESINNITTRLDNRLQIRHLPNFLLGGKISGLCRKARPSGCVPSEDLYHILACPDCKIPVSDGNFDRPMLVRRTNSFMCPLCGFDYPVHDGIIFLLPKSELRQLYPEVSVHA